MADVENNHEEDKHESALENPQTKTRSKTDVACLYFFAMFCVITIIINAYGSFVSSIHQYNDESISPSLDEMLKQYGIRLQIRDLTPAAGAIIATFFSIFLVPSSGLLRWNPKIFVYIAVIALYISIIVTPLLFVILTFTSEQFWKISEYDQNEVLRRILYLIILIPTAICVKKEGVKAIADVVDKSCRTVICIQPVLSFIAFIVAYFLIFIFEIMLVFFIKSCIKTTLNGFLFWISLLGALYILSFCYYFGVAVVSKTVVYKHKSQNDEVLFKTALWESINTVYRFHLGTIAFGATFILPFFMAIVAAYNHTIETTGSRIIPRVFKLILIGHITDFALVQTTVHGHNFREATKRTFNLMVKNYSLSFALIMMIESIISIIVGVTVVLSLLLTAGCGYHVVNDRRSFNMVNLIFYLPMLMIVGSAVNATLVYMLEKRENEQNVRMNTISSNSQNGNVI